MKKGDWQLRVNHIVNMYIQWNKTWVLVYLYAIRILILLDYMWLFQSFGLFVGIACLEVSHSMTVSITFQMGIMLLGKRLVFVISPKHTGW